MEMTAETADCGGFDELPSPVQIPDVGLNVTEWTNKTLQQKHAEVLGALQVFQDGVQNVSSQVTLPCHNTSLNRLERSIGNYLAIFNEPPIQIDDLTPHSAVENCPSQTSLNKVLKEYRMLLVGKLESYVKDLQDTVCREESRTISNKGS